jgi:hypothetical protein
MANPDPKMDPALASMETLAHLASTALAKYERDYEMTNDNGSCEPLSFSYE